MRNYVDCQAYAHAQRKREREKPSMKYQLNRSPTNAIIAITVAQFVRVWTIYYFACVTALYGFQLGAETRMEEGSTFQTCVNVPFATSSRRDARDCMREFRHAYLVQLDRFFTRCVAPFTVWISIYFSTSHNSMYIHHTHVPSHQIFQVNLFDALITWRLNLKKKWTEWCRMM